MKEAFKQYKQAGLECLPCKLDKSPYQCGDGWKEPVFTEDSFINAPAIGLKCGSYSGMVEVIDFDNHGGEARKHIDYFFSIPEVKEIYNKYKFVFEISQHGGYHVFYKCKKIEGNRKLALKLLDGKPDTIIETRGEGGYVLITPSPGYKIIKNDICNIPEITPVERAILLDNACSMNEVYPKIIRNEYEGTDRPGDIYNKNCSSSEIKAMLTGVGWHEVSDGKWRRPGKKEGISATLDKVAPGVFYVFSSNCSPFEAGKAYSAFQILTFTKFNEDFKAAAKSLPQTGKVTREFKEALPPTELEKILKDSVIDTSKSIEKPPTILSIKEKDGSRFIHKRLFTSGNFSVIKGLQKTRKTFLVGIFTQALMNPADFNKKFINEMNEAKLILYFDTEQSTYDSYVSIKRIEKMAGHKVNLKAFNLREFSPAERYQLIKYAFELYGNQTGYVVIDGIADLVNDINDINEATEISSWVMKATKVYNFHITVVIHQNKQDKYATGHIGSAIMKKAEIIISTENGEGDVTNVINDMGRGIKFNDFEFFINDDNLPEISTVIAKKNIVAYYDKEPEQPEQIKAPY